MSIQNWPKQLQPRERLLSFGPQTLTDTELLAILLRTGFQGMNVIELADHLIQHFGSLNALLTVHHQQLTEIKGLGKAKATQLNAILEICRRVLRQQVNDSDVINSPDTTREYLRLHFQGLQREEFACLFLNTRHRVIALETLFQGTLSAAAVYPREVIKQALAHNAAAIILCHNHPSGDPEPSQADIRITEKLKSALALVDVSVLDHIVVGHGNMVSMAELGLL